MLNEYCVIFEDRKQVHKLYRKGLQYDSYEVKLIKSLF